MIRIAATLTKLDRKIASRVVEKLEYFMSTPDPLFYAKRIKDQTLGQYRFRIGDYRVLFDVNQQGEVVILYVLAIKHRSGVYL